VVSLDPAIPTAGRYMACSGGWDWAPFPDLPLTNDTASRSHTRGIWKSVYLVRVSTVAITAVVPQIHYRGSYPVQALVDGEHDGFDVAVRVHLWSPRSISGHVAVQSSWGVSASSDRVTVPAGESNVTISLFADARSIKLWWPAGMGPDLKELSKRMLYDIVVSFSCSEQMSSTVSRKGSVRVHTKRRIGFRHFALVTGNDTDPVYVRDSADKEGTKFHGLFFRVNGVPLYSRGANVIPMEEMAGSLSAEAHIRLVQSSVEANFNTLRIWGGGMFLLQAFYQASDEYGILIYHDMMYAQGGHFPAVSDVQEEELRHNIRKLSSHPSIAIWDGCNECRVDMNSPTAIYANFVLTVVAEEDKSRSIWPSSPAAGWMSGVSRLTSQPSGTKLITPSKSEINGTIETHGSYVHGTGFPAVNGADALQPIHPDIPITLAPDPSVMGIASRNVYASEFGCVTMSSFESISATLKPSHWGIHGGEPPDDCSDGFDRECQGNNPMAQRNYPCDNVIEAYFDTEPGYFEGVGEYWFRRQLYHCMIGQALNMKSNIETRRSRNELGHLVWQLNEIWPTGGWGSLEYGNADYPGQVLGGRWKPLHYWFRSTIFADVMASCGMSTCYIRNDSAGRSFHGSIVVKSVNIATGIVDWSDTYEPVSLLAGPGALDTFVIPGNDEELDGSTHILLLEVVSGVDGSVISHNTLLRKPPKDIINLPFDSGLELEVGDLVRALDASNVVPINITSGVPLALFVTLTTLANGRFSDNAFTLYGSTKTVYFIPFGELQLDVLRNTIRVEDMAMYQKRDASRSGDITTKVDQLHAAEATEVK